MHFSDSAFFKVSNVLSVNHTLYSLYWEYIKKKKPP